MTSKPKRTSSAGSSKLSDFEELIECIEVRGSNEEAIIRISADLDIPVIVVEQLMIELLRRGLMSLITSEVFDILSGKEQ